MSRSLLVVIIVAVVLVAGLFLLAGRSHEKPLTHVEKVVPLANLSS